MGFSRRRFLSALGALAVARSARADRRPPVPCGPPEHQGRLDREWRHLPDAVQPSGFVSYTAEPFPFPSRIAPGVAIPVRTAWSVDEIAPSCATADPNALARRGSLVDAILSDRPTERCLHLGDEPAQILARLAGELREKVAAAPADTILVPVGSHHSSSGTYRPPSFDRAIAVDTGGINVVYPLDVRGPNGGPLVVCGAGITLCQLNETLWKLGLALPTLGSFDVQTLAGATSTGTHGSAAHVGATSDLIVAIVALVSTRPDRWSFVQIQARPDDAPRLPLAEHLVADDDVFQSFVVSMGLLGIFVAIVIEAREGFYLYRRRYARRWREIRPEMQRLAQAPPAGVRGRGWRYELYVNPVPTRRFLDFPLRAPSPGSTGEPEWIVQEVQLDEWDDDLDYRPQSLRLDWSNQAVAGIEEDIDIRPFRPSAAITSQFFGEESGEFVDRSYRVLRLEWTDSVRAWGTEMFVPLEHAGDAVDWLLQRNLALGYGHPDHLVHPFGVRFVRSRRGLLCPSRYDGDRFSCAIEPSVPVKAHARANADERKVLVRWADAFLEESERRGWNGRFHWGLLNDPFDRKKLEASYPEVDTWREVFLLFNRHGRFDTTLSRQLGLSAWRDEQGTRGTRFDALIP